MAEPARKSICKNRKAYFQYLIDETVEAGLVLTGSEVKSLRAGAANLSDSYAQVRGSEVFLMKAHIAPYTNAGRENHLPERPRKLLLKRREIDRLGGRLREKGLTLVPIELYFKEGRAKVELGLGRGKKLHDKREAIATRESERSAPPGGAAPRQARMRRLAAFALAAGLLAGCDKGPPDYHPSRFDYWSFRARVGNLPEPNYLPWALHVESLPDGAQALVACRFPDAAFPLRYFVAPPEIPEALESDDSARVPADYVRAVEEAFDAWQKAIGRPVRFERVERREDAQRRGAAPGAGAGSGGGRRARRGARRGRALSRDGSSARHRIVSRSSSRRHEATLYIADSVGLLTQRQVRAVALHEIGHLLGVSGRHSPLAGDVMYPVAGDRRIEALSDHDRGTLRALYAVPPGSVYARARRAARGADRGGAARSAEARRSRRSDERNGFRVRFPKDWQVIRTPSGLIAVDGVSWDYDASIQVIAARGTPGAHLSLLAGQGLARGDDVRSEVFELDGEPIARLVTRGAERAEETDVIAWREGWVLIVIADSRARDFNLYQPWFQRVLLSLEPLAEEDGDSGRAE